MGKPWKGLFNMKDPKLDKIKKKKKKDAKLLLALIIFNLNQDQGPTMVVSV